MKWKKHGKIFDPSNYALALDCFGFAQSPQTIVFDDFVRIYFASRQKTKDGKFLSHTHFIDMDKSFTKVLCVSNHEIIPLGKRGTFDEHGIFPFHPFRHENKIYGYTSGWTRRRSVSVDTGIGLSFSHDNGETFQKLGNGPVLASSLYEPFLVCDPFVRFFEGKFHMWYIYGTSWQYDKDSDQPERTYVIAQAISDDGIHWTKTGRKLIEQKTNYECQALPSVVFAQEQYHMFFCYRDSFDFRKNPKNSYKIGYASSFDLIEWERHDESGLTLSSDSFDSDMMAYPHIFECDGKIYMLYNGNEFGRYGFGLAELESF